MNNRMIYLTLALTALLLAGLACSLPARQAEQPADREPIPVSTEAVATIESNIESAVATATTTGKITVEITEAQLTSVVAQELQKQETPILTEPQIYLRDGKVEITGKAQQSGFSAPLDMFMTVTVENGQVHYQVVSAKLGPLPLPQSMLDQFTEQINAALGSQLSPETSNMNIETITIADGKMVITGQAR
jgi:uncharacterized protein YpmS